MVRLSRASYMKKRRSEGKGTSGKKAPNEIIGIDGEGITIDGKHRYIYLAACSETGLVHEISRPTGLSSIDCLGFFLAVKKMRPNSTLFGFSLGYDYTKILEDLPAEALYKLFRPETRKRGKKTMPVYWGPFCLNYLRGRLTIAVGQGKERQSVSIWDVFGFFQGAFIDACKNWGIIDSTEYDYLKSMKDGRSTFKLSMLPKIAEYCQLECRRLAMLVSRLRNAHIEAGLPLANYYGAGSTATVLLKNMGVKEHMPGVLPKGVEHAAREAFFGGRFEVSVIGLIKQHLYAYDIASAYPYQLYHLPCLACGTWERVGPDAKRSNVHYAVERARWAIVRYQLVPCDSIKVDSRTWSSPVEWGPFPFRAKGLDAEGVEDGSIIYPVTSGGGWVYRDEYLAGCKAWPNVRAVEAWIYHPNCDHRPFAGLANMYIKRLQWGKEGRGIVVKLGTNSVFGKTAQTIGDDPPFQCFLWAGMTTSGTRAQLLDMIAQGSVILTATDGVVSTDRLKRESPLDTGTASAARAHGKEPLGAWEEKEYPDGMFLVRPGIAFPLGYAKDEKEAVKETKARGLGKAVLRSYKDAVLESWEKHGPNPIQIKSTLFHGAKSSCDYVRGEYVKRSQYGQWLERKTELSYMPEPKRPWVQTDGRLHTWALPLSCVSAPYERILTSEAKAIKERETLELEQPDYVELERI